MPTKPTKAQRRVLEAMEGGTVLIRIYPRSSRYTTHSRWFFFPFDVRTSTARTLLRNKWVGHVSGERVYHYITTAGREALRGRG